MGVKFKIRSKEKKFLIFNLVVGIILLVVLPIIIFISINSNKLNLDNRSEAAGKTIFVDPSMDLQQIIDSAGDSDAIFLNPGEYLLPKTLSIIDKKIRILGSGENHTTIRPLLVSNKGNLIEIFNSNITIESLSISGSNGDGIKVSGNSKLGLMETSISGNNKNGILFEGTNLLIQRSNIQENGVGILVYSGDVEIYSSFIKNSASDGIIFKTQNSNLTIRNSILEKNKQSGVKISGGKEIQIKNVNLVRNGIGLQEESENSKTSIINTIIQENQNDGLKLNRNSTITYSSYFKNGSTNIQLQTLNNNEGMVFQDANFIAVNDYRLSPNSPLKDKGLPNEFDPDGTRIDIGAYGGSNMLPSINNPPVIKSTPKEYVKPDENYRYEIVAEDSDGDNLVYVAMNTLPSWLKLEKNILEGTPTKNDIGYYGVIIVVSDRKGGNTVHAININVLPDQVSGSASPPSTTTPSPTFITNIPTTQVPTPPPTIVIPKIQIISPTNDEVFNAENNQIKWQIQPESTSIEKIKISYSSDGDNYKELIELPGSSTAYKWNDIENLLPGKYFIKIQAIDVRKPDLEIAAISPQFQVQKLKQNQITITKNSPSDNDVVKDNKIQIVVEFKPETELDKSQTKLIVEGKEVAYRTTKNTIYYQPAQPYQGTRVKVEVYLVTAEGATASKQWIFNIEETVNPANTNPDVFVKAQICIPGTSICLPQIIGLICIGIFVLILLILIMIFAIRIIKNIRDQRQGNIEHEFSDFYGEDGIVEIDPKNTKNNLDSKNIDNNHPNQVQNNAYDSEIEYQEKLPPTPNANINYNDYLNDTNATLTKTSDGNNEEQSTYYSGNTQFQETYYQEANNSQDSLTYENTNNQDQNTMMGTQDNKSFVNPIVTPQTVTTNFQAPAYFQDTGFNQQSYISSQVTQTLLDNNSSQSIDPNLQNTGISPITTSTDDSQASQSDDYTMQHNKATYTSTSYPPNTDEDEYLKKLMEKYGIDPKKYSSSLSNDQSPKNNVT